MNPSINAYDMLKSLWATVPGLQHVCEANLFEASDTSSPPIYAVLGEVACYLIDRLEHSDTDMLQEIFSLVEEWHLNGDPEVRAAATIGLLEDLQNANLHRTTRPDQFREWLLPETLYWWQQVDDFWSKTEDKRTRI